MTEIRKWVGKKVERVEEIEQAERLLPIYILKHHR